MLKALRQHRDYQERLRAIHGPGWNTIDLVFPTATGIPMQPATLTHEFFRPVCLLAGIPYSQRSRDGGLRIHDLRHTMATRHLKKHKNLMMTKTVLGHSTVKMTERYVHLLAMDEDLGGDSVAE